VHITRIASWSSLCALTFALFAAQAVAQEEPAPQTRADELFHEGRRQYTAGDFPAACGNFEASYKLVPRPGTLYNLGVCHKELGQYLRARRELMQVRTLAERDGPQERAASADAYIHAIEAELGWIQVAPVGELAATTPHLRLDGSEIELAPNQPFPVLPGEHTLRLEADGYEARELSVETARGMHVRVVFPPLERKTPAVVAAPAAATLPDRPVAPAQVPSDSWSPVRTTALVVGIVGVAASIGLGAWALERKGALQEHRKCFDDRAPQSTEAKAACSSGETSIANTGQTVATLSTVAFAVGGVGFGAWVFLPGGLFNPGTAPDTRAGLTIRGAF
jgi:hypothetical protein